MSRDSRDRRPPHTTRGATAFLAAFAIAFLLSGVSSAAEPARGDRFEQDRFVIGFWVDPPVDASLESRYDEIAEANFTLVLAFSPQDVESQKRVLAACEKRGLKAIVGTLGLPPEKLVEAPACWGYLVRDEPNAADFAALGEQVADIRKARPGRLALINLFPTYASKAQLGTKTYDEHVRRFLAETKVDVLSMDHYPQIQPGQDGRAGYRENLEIFRKHAEANGMPFWNFFNIMPYGPHYDPTEAVVRWQIYTSIAYGAKGVLYFCYWTPRGAEFPKGGAIITAEGRRTRHYEQAKRINTRVRRLGPVLMELTSTRVVHVPPGKGMGSESGLAGTPIASIDTTWPTVQFALVPERAVEVSQETGLEVPVLDDSPDMPGLQLSLDSGEGRLFLFK
jgi:hypothetical protein